MYMAIGNNIKILRKEKGITQVELAKLLGTSQQVITAYEREKTKPDADKIPEIAEILGYPIQVLFNPELRFYKESEIHKSPRKGSRLSKVQEAFEKLSPNDQRFLLKQIEGMSK
jgi:transcriptional regulator with XRE-family HTH domain